MGETEEFKQSKAQPPNQGVASEGPYIHPGGDVDVGDIPVPNVEDTSKSGEKFGRIGDATMPDEEHREPPTQRGATTSPPS